MNQTPETTGDTERRGAITRARAGVDAVRVLAALRSQERPATSAERATLAGWPGWGPLAPVFNPPAGTWQTLRDDLGALLSEADLTEGSQATYSAFYTPRGIVRACWDIARSLGFDGGRVLEPGCGPGVFIDEAPTDTAEPVHMVGVERDPTTAGIAAALHPGARIIASPFEESPIIERSYDAAVGNVPFGNVTVFDPDAPRSVKASLHGYFIWRAVQALRPGGVAVLITSRYLLDAAGMAIREAIAKDAAFLGAVRLPNAALISGGTETVTDIVVLRRRAAGDPGAGSLAWLDADACDGWNGARWPQPHPVNAWLTAHPDQVLGEMTADAARGQYGRTLRVDARPGAVLADDLAAAGARIVAAARADGLAYLPADKPGPDLSVPLTDAEGRKERSFHIIGGAAYQVTGGRLSPVTRKVKETARPLAGKELAELSALVQLRDAALTLVEAEADHTAPDQVLSPMRARLNALYDGYTAAYGYLGRFTAGTRYEEIKEGSEAAEDVASGVADAVPHPKTGKACIAHPTRTLPRMAGFRHDPDYSLVLALEVFDEEEMAGAKAPIFRERVNVRAVRKQHAETPAEALALCLDECGRVDLPTIARALQLDGPDEVPAVMGELLFYDPGAAAPVTADEYLSGKVRAKLRTARLAAEVNPDMYARNVAALEAVQPVELTAADIRARLGAPWIPASDVAAFLGELLGHVPTVKHTPITATWEVEISGYYAGRPAASSVWGTERVNAYRIAELALNGRAPVVTDRVKTSDGEKSVKNVAETMAAEAKQRELAARFGVWIWEDDARAARLVADYNRRFNSVRRRAFDGSHLTFPGLASWFQPYRHQVDMTYRAVSTESALCGHDVGAGKTATMFLTAMTLRRLGLARKPLIVVPNHILEQVTAEGRRLFPGARILMAGKDDLGDAYGRRLFAARAAVQDWDAVVITHNAFKSIPVHPRTEAAYLEELAAEYRAALRQADKADQAAADATGTRSKRSRSTKQLAKMADTFKAKAKELLSKSTDDGLFFEYLAVDYLLIDEAHYFKNLAVPVRTDGFTIAPSKRASDLDMKIRLLRGRGKRVCTLFTGTPVSNTMLEMYVLQHYLNPGRLAEIGISSPDAWAANFVQFKTAVEVDPTGQSFRLNRRPSRFVNRPELRALLSEVADIRTADDLGIKRPATSLHTVVCKGSPLQREFIAHLARRADSLRGGGASKRDNMLSICTDGRKAALDMALVGVADPYPGKAQAVADQAAMIYHATKNVQYPGDEKTGARGTLQIVFCDMGTPGDNGSQTYGKMRAAMVEAGIPRERIRFIHDAATDAAKSALFDDCRAGRVSVLFGSTDKLGVGTNIQDRVIAMHDVDAPWRPADVQQRHGRGKRKGNLNPLVLILRYVTEGSFDSYMWQALERKQIFIWDILCGDDTAREVEDIGDGTLSYGEAKALATGNPLLLEKADIDARVAELATLYAAYRRDQQRLSAEARGDEDRQRRETNRAEVYQAIADTAAGHAGAPIVDAYGAVVAEDDVNGQLAALTETALHNPYGTPGRVVVRGVRVTFGRYNILDEWQPRAEIDGGAGAAEVRLSRSWLADGQAWRILREIMTEIDRAAGNAGSAREWAAECGKRAAEARALIGAAWPRFAELTSAQARQDQIAAQLREAADAKETDAEKPAEVPAAEVFDLGAPFYAVTPAVEIPSTIPATVPPIVAVGADSPETVPAAPRAATVPAAAVAAVPVPAAQLPADPWADLFDGWADLLDAAPAVDQVPAEVPAPAAAAEVDPWAEMFAAA